MGAPATWFEISSANSKALLGLYSEAFKWKLQTVGDLPYALADAGVDGAMAGGSARPRARTR